MTCFRGAPNRVKRSEYNNLFERYNFKILREIIVQKYDEAVVKKCKLYIKKNNIDVKDLEFAVIVFICKRC